MSFVVNAGRSNYGSMYVILKPFHERATHRYPARRSLGRLRERLRRGGRRSACSPSGRGVQGLGNAGGFKLMVEATGDVNFDV